MRAALEDRLQRTWLGRGPWAIALWPLACVFAAIASVRRLLYRHRWLRPQALPVPVVVVGNLIAGGAGKTPTVMAVARWLQAEGWTPAIISRGHGRSDQAPPAMEVLPDSTAAQAGDEPLLLRLRTGLPVFVGARRVAAARQALAAHPQTNIFISDDGLQHLQLPRTAQVIVFDERGAGNGWLLPAGPLRETLSEQPPARSVVLYNAPAASTPWPGHLARRHLSGLVDLASWWAGRSATMGTLHALAASGAALTAAAGLAHPQRFFDMLSAAGLRFTPLPLPDHHSYPRPPWSDQTEHVIVTEKDAVKLRPELWAQPGSRTRIWVAPLDFECDAAFLGELRALLPPPPLIRNADGYPTA
jgi:tetraacyldisaccharide 4'-kinase